MTRKIYLFSCLIFILIIGCSKISGIVINPKIPEFPKPQNLISCKYDADCMETTLEENSCCLVCPRGVNLDGKRYLEEWYQLNCKDSIRSKGCWHFECVDIDSIRCVNNTCNTTYKT